MTSQLLGYNVGNTPTQFSDPNANNEMNDNLKLPYMPSRTKPSGQKYLIRHGLQMPGFLENVRPELLIFGFGALLVYFVIFRKQ